MSMQIIKKYTSVPRNMHGVTDESQQRRPTFVIRPCMITKLGLLIFSWTPWNSVWMLACCALCPFSRYLDTAGRAIWFTCVSWISDRLWLEDDVKHLSSNSDLLEVLKASRTFRAVRVVKDYSDTSFRHSGLTTLVNEILLVRSTHLYIVRVLAWFMNKERNSCAP